MRKINVILPHILPYCQIAVIVSVLYLLQYFRFRFRAVLKSETQLKLIIMTKNEQNEQKNENQYQELSEQILALFKGKKVSICKQVLKDLIVHGIDKKSIVN